MKEGEHDHLIKRRICERSLLGAKLLISKAEATAPKEFFRCDSRSNRSQRRAGKIPRRIGCLHAARPLQGLRSGNCRRAHRVHSGLLHRTSAVDGALLRLQRRCVRQDLRRLDSAWRDPRDPLGLLRAAVAHRPRHVLRSCRATLCHWRADRIPAGRRHRRSRRRLHQGNIVQSVGGLLHADRRRRNSAVGRPTRSEAALSRCHRISAADVSRHRHRAMRRDDSGRIALRSDHRVGNAVRLGQEVGGRIFVLPGDADNGRRVRVRSVQELQADDRRPPDSRRGRVCDCVRCRADRGANAARLCVEPRLYAVCVVARDRRHAWADRTRARPSK